MVFETTESTSFLFSALSQIGGRARSRTIVLSGTAPRSHSCLLAELGTFSHSGALSTKALFSYN